MLSHYPQGRAVLRPLPTAGRTSRLIYTEATGRGGRYGYFLCRSRQEGLCDLPHLAVAQVEEAIAAHYSLLQAPEDFADAVRNELEMTMTDQQQLTQELHTTLTRQLTKLEAREERLIDLAADGVLTRAKIQQRSNTIQLERTRIQAQLADTGDQLALGAQRLRESLDLVTDPASLYRQAPDETRRQLNQTFYQRFYLNDDNQVAVTDDVLNPPFDEITEATWAYQRQKNLALGPRLRRGNSAAHQAEAAANENRPGHKTGPVQDHQTPVLADIFRVSGSSKRVMVVLTGVSSNLQRGLVALASRPRAGRPVVATRSERQVQARLADAEVARLIAAYQAGTKINQLATDFGINRNTVSSILRSSGVEPRRGLSADDTTQGGSLYRAGLVPRPHR